MSYESIVKLIVTILTFLITAFTIYQYIYTILGIFFYKKFPKAKKEYCYGILIAARNEEKVIGNLIRSIYAQDYPQDKLKIFVVADNCTDKTADIVRELIAEGHENTFVYEHNNPNERTKGFALKYLLEQMKADGLKEGIDGYFVFDADNILNVDYVTKMNDAFDFYDGKRGVTSFRNSKNFNTNPISACYGLWFYRGCRFEMRGRTMCNCSTRVSGTGYLATAEMMKDGWPYVTLTEDWEFSADQVLNGRKIMYCEEAIFYDEQPTNFKVMWRQRVRWAKGHLLVCLTKYASLFKNLFRKKDKNGNKVNRVSTYDMMWRITPVQLVNFVLTICQYIALAFLPLAGVNAAELAQSYLILTLFHLCKSYLTRFIVGIIMVMLEYKHLQQVGGDRLGKIILTCLFYPIFNWLTLPILIVALFSRNLQWKTIPHKDTTSIEDIKAYQQFQDAAIDESDPKVIEPGLVAKGDEIVADETAKEDESDLKEENLKMEKLKEFIESEVKENNDENEEVS